ncbi:MAG: hypothetical protein R3C53_25030 [Pirellulaceae bacterium]
MFLIVATWNDNSDSIFLVGKDPTNKHLPDWNELLTKLDTIADPADAKLQFARVSREFILLKDQETSEYSLDDSRACSQLKPLKLTKDMHLEWYQSLLDSKESNEGNAIDDDEPEF